MAWLRPLHSKKSSAVLLEHKIGQENHSSVSILFLDGERERLGSHHGVDRSPLASLSYLHRGVIAAVHGLPGPKSCSFAHPFVFRLFISASVFMLASALKVIFPHHLLLVGRFVFAWRSKDVRCLFSLTGGMSAWLSSSICNALFSFWLFFRFHLAGFECFSSFPPVSSVCVTESVDFHFYQVKKYS